MHTSTGIVLVWNYNCTAY